jgi:hypothetical protein
LASLSKIKRERKDPCEISILGSVVERERDDKRREST